MTSRGCLESDFETIAEITSSVQGGHGKLQKEFVKGLHNNKDVIHLRTRVEAFAAKRSSLLFGCEAVSNQNTQQALALPEKEVIQPHLPVRLPCYDFTPVTSPAFGIPLLAVKVTTSGMASSRSVTGGVYKARERIHRRMADRRLLAIPASCRRVAACNPN
ncbi:hypothetical protein V6N12_062011 [Hibiscus sabdariffa]|uniref:Uncharacterized protein n=1 Tax=Hibiscus sabdariffa TaxID=183260 RepID=A0ABR2DZ38_9ROSI